MSNAKEASEAEHLGNKLLQLCRKKAPEKDLLQVLEVCVFKFFQMCARAMIALNARVFPSLYFSFGPTRERKRRYYSFSVSLRVLSFG
jgi:hypothetical protein